MKNSVISLIILSVWLFIACSESRYEEAQKLVKCGRDFVLANKPDSAIIFYRKAIELVENTDENQLIGELYNEIGNTLLSADVYEKGRVAYKDGYRYNQLLKDKTNASRSLRGIGKSFLFRLDLDSASVYFLKAKELLDQVCDSNEISCIYDNLAGVYTMQEKYGMALYYNQMAINMITDSVDYYRNWLVKANLLMKVEQYDSARYYFVLSSQSSNIYTKAGSYLKRIELCRLTSDADSSKYMSLYHTLKDSIECSGLQNPLKSIEEQHTLNQVIEKERQKRLLLFTVIALVCSALVLFLIIRYKSRLKLEVDRADLHFKKHQKEMSAILKLYEDLQRELEQNKKDEARIIENTKTYERLAEIRSTILCNAKRLANNCLKDFVGTKSYLKTKKKLQEENGGLSNEDKSNVYKTIMQTFKPFVHYLISMGMPMEDCYLCILALSKYSTKECASLRGVTVDAIRSQRTRIKKRIMDTFDDVELFNFIFH